ncbi:transcription elongation factor GreA [Spirochaetia bacterium]|nr:transcription elongation factor GreA [Spirochaetia bacterium]
MSEVLLKNVQNMLNEEKFTRATLSNYSIDKFKEFDILLDEAKEKQALTELKKLCDEHLSHTKNSIIAVYFSGIAALSQQIIDDAVLINLVSIFVDNKKINIVRYLCERILDFGEAKFALRTLSDCYKNDNEEEKIIDVWKRLVKVDSEEAEITKLLAERAEKLGDTDEAVDYYKKALHRYINKQLFTNVREIWLKLIEYHPEDIDFFLHVQTKVAKNITQDKAAILLKDVYDSCKKRGDIDTAITILKIILNYDERDNNARKEITECYRQKYANHSQLEDCIKVSNLTQNWRNVHEAIQDFEKHIAFDKGNFVFHRTWGAGRIAKLEGDTIVIDFAKHRGHSMSLKMAVDALQTLDKNHIWVLKATMTKEKLHDKIKTDVAWALKTIIKSFGNYYSLKQIKAELVPQVLTSGEWTSWNVKAKEILTTDPSFGVSTENIDIWTVREHPIEEEEKRYNEFKAEKKFYKRVEIIRKLADLTSDDGDSEYFKEALGFFHGFLKSYSQTTDYDYVVSSYLILKNLAAKFPFIASQLQLNFLNIFDTIENVSELFMNIKDDELRRDFLNQIKLFVSGWQSIYIKLFSYAASISQKDMPLFIIDTLKKENREDKIISLIKDCFENYKDNREAVVWFYKNYQDDPVFAKADLSEKKIIIALIHILDVTYREIDNNRNTTENKKINKQVHNILFKENILNNCIDNTDSETIIRIWTLLEDVADLDPADKLKIKTRIEENGHDLKNYSGVQQKEVVSRKLIVTMAKYQEKQKQLSHIMEEEVPANSKEIAFALSLGDLRENAEYKAAKEKQELLNSTVAKLKDEIDRAQLFDPATLTTNRASFGTIVTLANESTGADEIYTLLGPWESDPDNKVISYMSPFGAAIFNKRIGDKFEFSMNEGKTNYTVKEINKAVL